MYSVILLLASVTLTVSRCPFLLAIAVKLTELLLQCLTCVEAMCAIIFLRPERPDSLFKGIEGNNGVRLSSGPVCPSEQLEAGPQAGTLSHSTVRRLPPLLHRLREAVEDKHSHTRSSCTFIQKEARAIGPSRFPPSPPPLLIKCTDR